MRIYGEVTNTPLAATRVMDVHIIDGSPLSYNQGNIGDQKVIILPPQHMSPVTFLLKQMLENIPSV